MSTYRISGTAQTAPWLGDVSPLDEAVAGEEGVTVEHALRTDDGGVDFTLEVAADSREAALSTAQRVADRLSPGSSVTVLDA